MEQTKICKCCHQTLPFSSFYPKKWGKKIHFIDGIKGVPVKNRAKERARFFPGIANAMAEQWGNYQVIQEVLA